MNTPAPALIPAPTLKTQATGYGLWFAFVTVDGRTYTGGGLSEAEAVYKARLKARQKAREARP